MKKLIVILLLATLIVIPTYSGHAASDETLVLYLPFDEGNGDEVKDQSQYENDGTIVENVEWGEGVFGTAIAVVGQTGDAVVIPDSDSLKIEGEITLMAWTKRAGNVSYGHVIEKNVHDGEELNSYSLAASQSSIGIFMGTGQQRQFLKASSPNMTQDEWLHVAVTSDEKATKFYLNGEMILETARSFEFHGTNNADVRIGSAWNNPEFIFNGAIDEVAIFTRALDEEEINKIMESGISAAVSQEGRLFATWASIKNQ